MLCFSFAPGGRKFRPIWLVLPPRCSADRTPTHAKARSCPVVPQPVLPPYFRWNSGNWILVRRFGGFFGSWASSWPVLLPIPRVWLLVCLQVPVGRVFVLNGHICFVLILAASSPMKICSFVTGSNPKTESPISLDLLPQAPKVIDLWRIEGEDHYLHLHQSDLIPPSFT
jgi:hypothetical protein